MMWAGQIFLGILGMSAGVVVAGGLFSFIVVCFALIVFVLITSRCFVFFFFF